MGRQMARDFDSIINVMSTMNQIRLRALDDLALRVMKDADDARELMHTPLDALDAKTPFEMARASEDGCTRVERYLVDRLVQQKRQE